MNARKVIGFIGGIGTILCVVTLATNLMLENYGMAVLMAICLYLNLDNFLKNFLDSNR